MKHRAILLITGLSIVTASSCTKSQPPARPGQDNVASAEHQDPEGYYTCPMHPQVHEHGPGPCPICGMALVKVQVKPAKKVEATFPGVPSTDSQLALAGIAKHKVTKKDLVFTLPVSGRLVSNQTIVFQIYESDISLIKMGMRFSGAPASASDQSLEGKIRSIDNLIDPASRTSRVMGILDKPFPRASLEGGFHGEIKIEIRDQIAIPEDAVLHTGLKDLVYVVDQDNRLKPVAVSLGKKAGAEYQVLSGLKEGEIITRGSNFLIDSEAKIRGSE